MFQLSTSSAPLLTSGGDSGSDSGERVEEHAYDDDPNAGEAVYFTDVDEGHTLTPITESTIVEGVDADVLKLPREDQRFIFVEVSPDWSLVVTVTSDGTFSVWAATNELVLVGLKRLPQDGRILKCIAFDPYNARAALLCFDSGEIFRTTLREPATSDDPGSSQEQRMFHMELVYMCEGWTESRFGHFKFSSSRKTMVYYNHDGEFAAVHFQEEGGLKKITLSKEFKLKQEPIICVSEQSILVSAMLQSSEDHEPGDEQIRTLVWSNVDFEDIKNESKPGVFGGKGYLSSDGKYVLVSVLAIEHESRCCHIEVHLIEDVKSSTNMKCSLFAARILGFTSNHPHLECLDRNQFNFLYVEDGNIKPLIAIHQTNSVANRLLFWDTSSDAIIDEIDLTLVKESRKYSEVKYCWSSDHNWLGVCSIGAGMMGLVCARSGVFVWKAHVPQMTTKDAEFCTLLFDPIGTRLMIYLGKLIYLLEPPCLSKKPQKHPMRDNLLLSQDSRRYSDFEILEMAKEWPKQVLFNVLVAGQRAEQKYQHFLLDAAISFSSKRLAVICKKDEGHCFLSILDYGKTSSWESLWFVIMLRWNRCFLTSNTFPLVKEINGDRGRKGISVFYYPNEETSNEQVVLLSSEGGVEVLHLDSELKQLSDWTRISNESCLSFTQSKDRRSVISLANGHVFVVDLNKKLIVKNVKYSFGLSQWWENLLDQVKFFAYSQYRIATSKECDKEHKLFLQERLRGLFDISEDGEKILIGWDDDRNKSLVITPNKSEEQFRIEWDEAHESLYQCSMLTRDGQWLGFVDHKKLRGGDIVVCVVNTESNRQQCIWFESNELPTKPSLESQPSTINFFVQIDESKERLTTLGLEEIGPRNEMQQFFVELVHDTTHAQDHHSLLEDMTQPINLDRYGESYQPYIFNMNVANISNFQRVWVEEGEDKLKEITKQALDNKVKVSDVYRFRQDKEENHTSLLMHALKKKEAAKVQLCLDFIKDGLFTFHSASAMVKDSFFEMLLSYNELIGPMLKMNSLTLKVAEVIAPAKVYQSHNVLSDVVFTSDTIFDPDEHFVNMASEHFGKTKSKMRLELANNQEEGLKVLSYVYFFYIANACKVGLNGIIRKLLMKDVALATFNTGLVRAVVCWKWEKLWKQRCLRELYMYLVFLVLFTSYAICLGVLGDHLVHDNLIRFCLSSLLVGVVVLAICFSFDEYKQLRTYVKDGKEVFSTRLWGVKHYFWNSKWNLVDVCSYFLVLVLIPIFHLLYIFGNCPKKPLFAMVAIESLLAWFKLWYYAQPFEQTSALVLLIRNVVHDCLPFLGLAFVILVGFSVALFVLFRCFSMVPPTEAIEEEDVYSVKLPCLNCLRLGGISTTRHDDDDDDDDEGELIHESFGSVRRSLSTLFYAMVGTLEVEVYYNHQSLSWLTTMIFILYMALEMIVMLNMLIAIMSDTFDKVKNEEEIQIIFGRASFIDACEASLSASQIREVEKQIGKFLYVLTPKDRTFNSNRKSWKGKINVIEENIKKSINALEANVMKRIEQNMKIINDNKQKMENSMEQYFERVKEFFEEHQNKDHDLLCSIAKKIEALEMKIDRPITSMGHQTT